MGIKNKDELLTLLELKGKDLRTELKDKEKYTNSKYQMLLRYLALQPIDIQHLIFTTMDEVKKILDEDVKIQRIKNDNIGKYNMILLCSTIEMYRLVDKQLVSKPLHLTVRENSKEALIVNNINIIENILLDAKDNNFNWLNVEKKFIDSIRPQLSYKDKKKKDCTHIISLSYFIRAVKKHLYADTARNAYYFTKADVRKLLHDAQEFDENKRLDILKKLNTDSFDSAVHKK